MNILTNAVPVWVSILFIFGMTASIFLIARTIKMGAITANLSETKAKSVYNTTLVFFLLFFAYVGIMSVFTTVFQQNTIPPKILLFTAIPLMLFYFLVLPRIPTFKSSLSKIPLTSLVGIHIFRLIGIFFLITHAYGALPTQFAYTAGMGDITTAIASIFVVKAIEQKKNYARALTIAWNIFGILDIISVIVSALVVTKLSIQTGVQGVQEIANFPFCLIPAFAPATIIFMHYLVFKKLFTK
jgi:hypothetical protein